MNNQKLRFQVPVKKQFRMIVDTDAINEADDQFAIAHHLITPMFEVKGIIATHFENKDHTVDVRLLLEDFYAKLQLNYGS